VQLQEDGLPVMEFGDIIGASSDTFLRADLNLERVESIRGGSASTFASNSPGGIINFISATGEQAGGMLMLGSGIDLEQRRADFDYGGPLGENTRFHVGGFGARRRRAASALKGSVASSFNVTAAFAGGCVRLYAKLPTIARRSTIGAAARARPTSPAWLPWLALIRRATRFRPAPSPSGHQCSTRRTIPSPTICARASG
jgi:hypothetical protein